MLKGKWLGKNEIVNESGLIFYAEDRDEIFQHPSGVGVSLAKANHGASQSLGYDLRLFFSGFETYNGKLSCKEMLRGDIDVNNARHVYEFVGADSGLSIRAGLTVHDTNGSWSSWPMHEFEHNAMSAPIDLDPEFYELFAYVTNPPGMWGIQCGVEATSRKQKKNPEYTISAGTWTIDNVGNQYILAPSKIPNVELNRLGVFPFRDHDITSVALGSHPIVAAPGVRLAYFWCYESPLNLIGAIEKFV